MSWLLTTDGTSSVYVDSCRLNSWNLGPADNQNRKAPAVSLDILAIPAVPPGLREAAQRVTLLPFIGASPSRELAA